MCDFIIQEIIRSLASWWEMPDSNVRLLKTSYQNLTSVSSSTVTSENLGTEQTSLTQGCSFSMMLVNLPVTAWAKAILHNLHKDVAGISAYVDDKVVRFPAWNHIEILLERTVHFDRLAGHFPNFDNSVGLCTTKEGMSKTQRTQSRRSPAPHCQQRNVAR